MDCRVADADAPNLGIRVAGQQPLRGRQGVVGHLEGPGIYVEGHDLAVIAGLHLGTHVLLVESCATPGMLFFAVAGLGLRHGFSPIGRDCTTLL
jgi:hypothetical protein